MNGPDPGRATDTDVAEQDETHEMAMDANQHQGMNHEEMSGSAATNHSEHDRHEGHSVAMFRDKFWLSLLLSVPNIRGLPKSIHSNRITTKRPAKKASGERSPASTSPT